MLPLNPELPPSCDCIRGTPRSLRKATAGRLRKEVEIQELPVEGRQSLEFKSHKVRGLYKPFGISIESPDKPCLKGRDNVPGLRIYLRVRQIEIDPP